MKFDDLYRNIIRFEDCVSSSTIIGAQFMNRKMYLKCI